PEESRRALLEPYSKQPSLGNTPNVPRPEIQTFGGPNSKKESQNATGGPKASQRAAAFRIRTPQRLADRWRQRQLTVLLLQRASRLRPGRSVHSARRFLPNSPSETISSIAHLLWPGRCRSAISNACKYSMR